MTLGLKIQKQLQKKKVDLIIQKLSSVCMQKSINGQKANDKMGKPYILRSSQQKFIQLAIKLINYNSKQDYFLPNSQKLENHYLHFWQGHREVQYFCILLMTLRKSSDSTCQNLVHTYSGEPSVQKGKHVI